MPGKVPKGKSGGGFYMVKGGGGGGMKQKQRSPDNADVNQPLNLQDENTQTMLSELGIDPASLGPENFTTPSGGISNQPFSDNRSSFLGMKWGHDDASDMNRQFATQGLLQNQAQNINTAAAAQQLRNKLGIETEMQPKLDFARYYGALGLNPSDNPEVVPSRTATYLSGNDALTSGNRNTTSANLAQAPYVGPTAANTAQTDNELSAQRLNNVQLPAYQRMNQAAQLAQLGMPVQQLQNAADVRLTPGETIMRKPLSLGGYNLDGGVGTGITQTHTEEPIVINGKNTGFTKQVMRTNPASFSSSFALGVNPNDGTQLYATPKAPTSGVPMNPASSGGPEKPLAAPQGVAPTPANTRAKVSPEQDIQNRINSVLADEGLTQEQKMMMIKKLQEQGQNALISTRIGGFLQNLFKNPNAE